MKLHSTLDPEQAKFVFQTVLKVPADEINFDEVSRVEVHGTDIDDPGEDYCEYRVFDLHDQLVKVKREMGY
jgi:hypothetical protein